MHIKLHTTVEKKMKTHPTKKKHFPDFALDARKKMKLKTPDRLVLITIWRLHKQQTERMKPGRL